MNIVVCIKQVVDTNDIKWTKNNTIDREGAQSIINPCDVLAIETALRLKDENTKITVITMGPPQAKDALKTALAMGCDEAYLLSDKKFSGADTVATSRTLSTAIKHVQPNFDLIICGQFASDGDTAQTGPSIAQKLGIEQVTYVSEVAQIDKTQKNITTQRIADKQIELIQTPLPALICVCDCPYSPRNILIDGYIKSQNTEIKTLSAENLNLSRDEIGIKGSPTWVSKAFRAVSIREKNIIKGSDLKDKSITDFLIETIENLKQNLTTSPEQIETAEEYKIQDEYKDKILIWGETNQNNELADVVYQLTSKATELASHLSNCKISVLTTCSNSQQYLEKLAQHGADELITINNDELAQYNTKDYSTAILQYLETFPATIFLIGATKQGRDLAPQISSALNTGLTADCTNLEIYENFQLAATRPTFGGELMATILCKTKPQMATVRAGVFKAKKIPYLKNIQHTNFNAQISHPSLKKIIKTIPIIKDETSLDSAKIILAGGKGLKDNQTFQKLRKLASLLNAKVGATRKAVDAGLAGHNEQIGQTGKTVMPEIYIAFGISGAIQHCIGVDKAKKIIAINIDENAPIIKNADLTIIADAKNVINEWISKLENK